MASLQWPLAGHHNRALSNSSTGALLVNTSYEICLPDGTTHATIYTDASRTATRTQPLTTDAGGNAGFFADPFSGLVLKLSGLSPQVIDVLPDVSDMFGTKIFSDGGVNTTYALSGADNLKDLAFLAGAGAGVNCVITAPNNIPKNFSCRALHEGGQGYISVVPASGATINGLALPGAPVLYHPGPYGWLAIECRYNASGTQADYIITNGLAAAP